MATMIMTMNEIPTYETVTTVPRTANIDCEPNGRLFDLPTEILCVIFLSTRDLSLSDPERFKATTCEVNISHVCKLWREIALGLPQLWNTYRYIQPRAVSWTGDVHERLGAYIQRSGTQPLDIWLNFRGRYAQNRIADQWNMIKELVAVAARWRRLTVLSEDTNSGLPSPAYHYPLINVSAPNLEHFAYSSIELNVLSLSSPHTFFNPKLLKAGAPALKSLRLDSSSFVHYLPPLHDSLTTLQIDMNSSSFYARNASVTIGVFTSVLKIPSLRHLSIAGVSIVDEVQFKITPTMEMAHLTELRCSSADIIELFQYIHTPALQTLVLKKVDFPLLPSESTAALTTLVLIGCAVPWRRLSTEMSYISDRITHLAVSEPAEGTFSRDALLYFDPREHWPRLEYLACNVQTASQTPFYIRFADLRRPKPLTLRVHRRLLDMWEIRAAESLASLRNRCELKGWDDHDPMMPHHWPYTEKDVLGYDKTDYDCFSVVSYH